MAYNFSDNSLSKDFENIESKKTMAFLVAVMTLTSFVALYLTAKVFNPDLKWISIDATALEPILYLAIVVLSGSGIVFYLIAAKKAALIQTSREQLKKANGILESRLAAMELTLDGIFITNKHGEIAYMNQSLVDLHGMTPEQKQDIHGQQWINLYADEAQNELQAIIPEHMTQHNSWKGELTLNTEAKKEVELTLTKLPDGGLIGTCHDVTKDKQASKEHANLQSQLYQAQKMEAIGRLAGGIAHDFNNILAAINGYSEFLIEDLDDKSSEKTFAEKILAATNQAKKLVDQILTFSRRNDSESEEVDLVSAVTENLAMIKASAMATINVSKNIEIDSAIIAGNSTQISQAIMNLCVNALDAMEEQHGELSVSLKMSAAKYFTENYMTCKTLQEDANHNVFNIDKVSKNRTILASGVIALDREYVCLSINDTGTGISREIMEHVFEPFFTTKPVDKGTGLGLATVHGVVLQHGGAILLDSTIGKGTRFDLFLPLAIKQIDQQQKQEQHISKFEFENARILLVEDQETVRDVAAKMLMRMGFTVITAECGQSALELINDHHQERPFDLVLSDHSMPNMTGLELAQDVEVNYPDLPFVMLSGYSEEKLKNVMKEHDNIKAVLRKPIEKDSLKDKLYEVLSEEGVTLPVDPIVGAA